jgi:hypothetical protein
MYSYKINKNKCKSQFFVTQITEIYRLQFNYMKKVPNMIQFNSLYLM